LAPDLPKRERSRICEVPFINCCFFDTPFSGQGLIDAIWRFQAFPMLDVGQRWRFDGDAAGTE
jgi:hypothetical protein